MRNLMKLLGAATLTIAFFAAISSATTVVRMDLPQLVQQSDSIVQGRVDGVAVQWDADRKLAFTYITISVDDPLKGERRRTVTIRQVGGKIGALNLSVAGMPQFRSGESVIVFLKAQADNTFQVVGMNQGKYEITAD